MRMAPKQTKETVVFVTNVGVYVNMELDAEFVTNAKKTMKHIIEKKIFIRQKDEVGIILTGVDYGENSLNLDDIEDYHNIEIPTFAMVQKAMEIQPTNNFYTNWVDGIRTALNMIENQAEGSERTTIIVIFDCYDSNELNENTIVDLSNTIVDKEIQVLWLGTKELNDLPDNELNESEKKMRNFCSLVVGEYMPFSHVLPKIEFYGTSKTNPMPWKCNIEMGEIKIPAAVYIHIVENVPTQLKWSTVSITINDDGDEELHPVNRNKALVDRHREEHTEEDTASGYMYGRKFTPMPEDHKKSTKYLSGPKSLKVYGFTREKNVGIEHRCGKKSSIVIPLEDGEREFFSLVKAMSDLKCVALVRRVYGENTSPTINVLYPQINDDGLTPWCLIMHEILFAEERAIVEPRAYDIILKSLKQEQLDSVDSLIDNMMLGNSVINEDTEKLYESGAVSSPDIQQIWNVLSYRALNPTAPLPEPAMSVLKLILPPERTNETKIADNITEIISLFDLNKEPEYVPIDQISTQKTQTATLKSISATADENLPAQMDVDLDALFD